MCTAEREAAAHGPQRLVSSARSSSSDQLQHSGAGLHRWGLRGWWLCTDSRSWQQNSEELCCPGSGAECVHQRTPLGQTPLFLAAEQGLMENAAFLLQRGADPDSQDQAQDSPLIVGRLTDVWLPALNPGKLPRRLRQWELVLHCWFSARCERLRVLQPFAPTAKTW